jgi:hypothetical protein
MGFSPKQCIVKGKKGEKRFMDAMRAFPYEFEVQHVGGTWDGGIDVIVRLFGEPHTVQCANWDQRTFSFSKWFERLQTAHIATFIFDGFKDQIITTTMSHWRDHLTWEKPGRDHSRAMLRAYLHSKGLRPNEIEEACRLA